MKLRKTTIILFFSCSLHLLGFSKDKVSTTDLLIIGGGASGTTAAVQAARMGVKTVIIEETEWLGGMLTSAGVSAIDGNHQMPSGLWGEFRQKLYGYYGGPDKVETGWVSNTLFEPAVGDKILKEMAGNDLISIWYQSTWKDIKRIGELWQLTVLKGKKQHVITAKMIIDATELGDVMAYLKVPYAIGMDSREDTGESFAPELANDIIQDMTYVVTLKDYGENADKTIRKPRGYEPSVFKECCDVSDPSLLTSPDNNCYRMMQYGRLPNNKYMINWPKAGNDIYLNIIEMTTEERQKVLEEAKLHSLRFVYYLQTVLGYKNLGIADDEYPTKDKLPMIPYHRESRRMKGLVTLTLNDVAKPYDQRTALYRTGIAVGDYPIDHHHLKNPDAPAIDFVRIKVPSYNVPLGTLIPEGIDGLIVAEKSISVTNIVNGATRLQPVVLTLGQAAGALAATSIKHQVQPREVGIRKVQQALLDAKAYIMPFVDVNPDDPRFAAIQRIGATGILKGAGVPYKWANQTWFYPEREISEYELIQGLREYYPEVTEIQSSGRGLSLEFLKEVIARIDSSKSIEWMEKDISQMNGNSNKLNRGDAAVLIDKYLKPFSIAIDFHGNALKTGHVPLAGKH